MGVCWGIVFIVVLLVHKSVYLSIMQDVPLVVPVLSGQLAQHWDVSDRRGKRARSLQTECS